MLILQKLRFFQAQKLNRTFQKLSRVRLYSRHSWKRQLGERQMKNRSLFWRFPWTVMRVSFFQKCTSNRPILRFENAALRSKNKTAFRGASTSVNQSLISLYIWVPSFESFMGRGCTFGCGQLCYNSTWFSPNFATFRMIMSLIHTHLSECSR